MDLLVNDENEGGHGDVEDDDVGDGEDDEPARFGHTVPRGRGQFKPSTTPRTMFMSNLR